MPSKYPIKDITLKGWRLIVDERIDALPVDPFEIAAAHGVKVLTYSDYCGVMGLSRNELVAKHGRDGFTLVIDRRHLIFHDENNNSSRIRWTVMHELSHVFLGHFEPGAAHPARGEGAGGGKSKPEAAADELTARILSPMIVLHLCCVASLDELQKLTGLSREASLYRWKRLCHLRRIKKFLRHELELEVARQFQPFITAHIAEKVALLNRLEEPAAAPPECENPE